MSMVPKYTNSHAILIGINEYTNAPPLGYAVNDATSLAELLRINFGFQEQNIHLMVNNEATKTSILDCFLSFASGGTQVNDRVIFFFAGHGHTVRARRGEVGYLVPYEGDPRNLATLIRWDEFTRNSDLIDAKHILFIMDACYGGLAITRALTPGSMRFLKDMLLRPARQVLTAGKANEVVADIGGPLPAHSVFTGHLLEALSGKAFDKDGILTANGLMAYVYQMVARDRDSHQTPHFGYLDGDGDFVFSAPQLDASEQQDGQDQDVLVSVPAVLINHGGEETMTVLDKAKEYLSENKYRINLHDLVIGQIKQVLSVTSDDYFPVGGTWSKEEFLYRLKKYEESTSDLRMIQTLLSYWGTDAHWETIALPSKHMAARLKPEAGLNIWNALRWYPVLLLLYTGGIASIAANKYHNLKTLFQTQISDQVRSSGEITLIRATCRGLSEINEAFKISPGLERHFVPRSEYLLKLLQPMLDDLLFLGTDYEMYFDRFEVFLAIEHAEQYLSMPGGSAWGPVGRFGWKYKRGYGQNPFSIIVAEADKYSENWEPLRAGLFGGSIMRFKEIVTQYEEFLKRLSWY